MMEEEKKKKKHPGGRPTKYKPEYAQELIDFFNVAPYKIREYENEKTGKLEIIHEAADLPTFSMFAIHIGVNVDTLHEWKNKKDEEGNFVHPEFSDAYKKAKAYQEHVWMQNTLKGGYQQAFSIFIGKNVIEREDGKKYTDKIVQENTGNINFVRVDATDEGL